MLDSNVPDVLGVELHDDMVRFKINSMSTNWILCSDSFVKRIDVAQLNGDFLERHLEKEIEIKNILDDGIGFLKRKKYAKAIECFDEVLFYDEEYGQALLEKSRALNGERHFVKSLRYYKRAVAADENLRDIEYHKRLMKEANNERDNFPRLKLNIYAGDEFFSRGEFQKAIESYNRALANPSKFKDKILSRLLNKKATALLKLDKFEEALECLNESLDIERSDYAIFLKGYCNYTLGLKIDDDFKGMLHISKGQMLKQAKILFELGFFRKSHMICDYLRENHFKRDDFYFSLLEIHSKTIST